TVNFRSFILSIFGSIVRVSLRFFRLSAPARRGRRRGTFSENRSFPDGRPRPGDTGSSGRSLPGVFRRLRNLPAPGIPDPSYNGSESGSGGPDPDQIPAGRAAI